MKKLIDKGTQEKSVDYACQGSILEIVIIFLEQP